MERVQGVLDAARKRIEEKRWNEALSLLAQLACRQLTPDEETTLRSLKAQVQQGARAAGAIKIGAEINRLLEESKTPR
ncbi:MAG: hypothetical protein FJ379_14155 [Verrucomicrobia bacterium]|nr:hypothetical protein [Verrucomicrobiota bacterium]